MHNRAVEMGHDCSGALAFFCLQGDLQRKLRPFLTIGTMILFSQTSPPLTPPPNRKGPPLRFSSFFGSRQTQILKNNPPLKTQTPFFKGGLFFKGGVFFQRYPLI